MQPSYPVNTTHPLHLQGALLMLLFQISHSLEEKFTARARGSVERLFNSVPSQVRMRLIGWIYYHGKLSYGNLNDIFWIMPKF